MLERRTKQAQFRDSQKTLDNFDFTFNKKMNRSLVFDLATGAFIARHEDALFLGPPGAGKSHLAQAIGQAAIQQGYRVLYRETHALLDELAEATLDGTRKEHMEFLVTVPLLILDDLGMRKLPLTAAEELLEIIMRRYERASTMLTSNRPVEDWGKLLGDAAAVSAMLDRLLHHGHVLKCGPRSWRTKTDLPPQEASFNKALRRGLHTRTCSTCGCSRSYSQAAAQVPSSQVTWSSPRRPWMNCRMLLALVSTIVSMTSFPLPFRTAITIASLCTSMPI